ncbi:MAG: aspartate kinase [Oscillospiraceae bacterium]|nr:aspartate kinase [Oscillospiraceae bacterium]
MQTKVLKFGGSSLADAKQFRRVAEIVRTEPSRRYVVASAPGKRFSEDTKVTDMLYDCYHLAAEKKSIDGAFAKIEERYNQIISELGLDFSLQDEFDKIKMSILHHAGRDYIASRGEYLNSMILAEYLGYDFIDAENCIFFFENGVFDSEKTNEATAEILSRHERAVIPGFYGVMPNGTIKTFSRGGSDITGSIVARAVNAGIYENWTDVSGMLMADPRLIDSPKTIDVITYKELRELAYMGATVLHEDAIFPVMEAKIPINIRNTNKPEASGTLIVPTVENDTGSSVVTGIAGKVGFSTITIEKGQMNKVSFISEVLQCLTRHKINIEHVPTGIDTISVVVPTDQLKGKEEEVFASIRRHVSPDAITLNDSIALIAVVGRKMVKSTGTAGRVFKAIGSAGVNIKMIDQGSSELNIIVAVDEKEYITALKAIYSEFVK